MAVELSVTIDAATGSLLVEGPDHLPRELRDEIEGLVGPSQTIGCAAPIDMRTLKPASHEEVARGNCVRVAGYWHDSLIEGPGRRTVVKLQGCPLRCRGCITPDSWDTDGGLLVPVDRLAEALLDPVHERDGVTILGGEPFAQPDALLALVRALRSRACRHILCYSGYTHRELQRRARLLPAIGAVLGEIDMLIDGPYVAALADGAGPWTGSANQRVLALKTRRVHRSSSGRRGLAD
jgi:anaerobic ribonucleoside-triphosphate reductase activating protein